MRNKSHFRNLGARKTVCGKPAERSRRDYSFISSITCGDCKRIHSQMVGRRRARPHVWIVEYEHRGAWTPIHAPFAYKSRADAREGAKKMAHRSLPDVFKYRAAKYERAR